MKDLHDTGVDRTVVVTYTVGGGGGVALTVVDGDVAVIGGGAEGHSHHGGTKYSTQYIADSHYQLREYYKCHATGLF